MHPTTDEMPVLKCGVPESALITGLCMQLGEHGIWASPADTQNTMLEYNFMKVHPPV